jgi:hypothetical protein
MILERDINTLGEEAEERAFNQDEVLAFFERAGHMLEDEIRPFFTGGDS